MFLFLFCFVPVLGNGGKSLLPPEMKSSLLEHRGLSNGMLVAGQKILFEYVGAAPKHTHWNTAWCQMQIYIFLNISATRSLQNAF